MCCEINDIFNETKLTTRSKFSILFWTENKVVSQVFRLFAKIYPFKATIVLSQCDTGLQIESLMIRISRRSISIIDYSPIRNPTTSSNRRSRFGYKIDLFRSEFDINRSLSIYFWLKDQKRPSKCRLFNPAF